METIGEVKETTAIDLGCLLDAGDGAVVTLVAGDTHLVAHRAVLAARSPVFAEILSHKPSESSSGQVRIPDVEGPVLRQLLAYCYTLQAPQLPDMALKLLVAADKYRVPVLKAECEKQVAAQLSVETVAAAAVVTIRHSCTMLRQAAIAYLKTHIFEVMATRGWADSVCMQPKHAIQLSQLLSETSVPAPAVGGTSLTPTSQPHSDHSQTLASAVPPTADSCPSLPPDDTAVPRPCAPSPAVAGASQSPSTQPHSDQGDCSPSPATAAQDVATSHRTLPPDEDEQDKDDDASRLHAPSPAIAGAPPSPSTQLHSDQGDCSSSPASAALPVAISHHTLSPNEEEDDEISRLRRLPAEQKNRRLVEAAGQGAVDELQALLAAGANAGAVGEWGQTALHLAARGGHEEAARRLLAAGAAVGDRDSTAWQWTPLHYAACYGHAAVVRLLLAARADHGHRDEDERTALHWAAECGHTEAAAALLQGGADRAARDIMGRTPLDTARRSNRRQVLQLLESR